MAVGLETGPKYLDQSKLYRLKLGEQIIFSTVYSQGWRSRRISQKEIGASPEFSKAHQEAVETAKRIETSPKFSPKKPTDNMESSEQEFHGCFRDIRVEVMRDVVTGHRIKGFTLIGASR